MSLVWLCPLRVEPLAIPLSPSSCSSPIGASVIPAVNVESFRYMTRTSARATRLVAASGDKGLAQKVMAKHIESTIKGMTG